MEEKIGTPLPTAQPEVEVALPVPSFWGKVKSNKLKILGGVLGVFVLVGAVFGAYKLGRKQTPLAPGPTPTPTPTPLAVATPTPDLTLTANWKTYTNLECKYLIKYPPELGVITTEMALPEGRCVKGLFLWGPTQGQGTEFHDGLVVFIYLLENKENLATRDYVEKDLNETKSLFPEVPPTAWSIQSITVGLVSGYKTTGIQLGSSFIKVFLSADGKNILVIEAAHGGPKDQEYVKTFNLMLSTFKFLE